jgi:hypothetical protein
MVMNTTDLRNIVRKICLLAIQGNLHLEEVGRIWPLEAKGHAFLKQVYDDIEDGVEHAPGFFFKRGIDQDAWQDTEMYRILLLDAELLAMDLDFNILNTCRKEVLQSKVFASSNIQESVRKWFANR